MRSLRSARARSPANCLARTKRLGGTSSASILSEISRASTTSKLRCIKVSDFFPHCGLANASTSSDMPASAIPTLRASNCDEWCCIIADNNSTEPTRAHKRRLALRASAKTKPSPAGNSSTKRYSGCANFNIAIR